MSQIQHNNPKRTPEEKAAQRAASRVLRAPANAAKRQAERIAEEAEVISVNLAQGNQRSNLTKAGSTDINFHAREQARADGHHRRTLIKAIGGSYTPEQWQGVLAKYGGCCLACGSDENITVDHVIPVALGGSSNIENLQPLCRSCNSSKGAQTIDYRK